MGRAGEAGGGSHIPFRQSKLTHLLKDSLGDTSYRDLYVHIWQLIIYYLGCKTTLITFQHFKPILSPLQAYFKPILTPFWHHFNPILTPFQPHFNLIWGGSCKTTMIANIWGDTAHIDETAATLRFATRIGQIANEAQVTPILQPHYSPLLTPF
jgi:hypothetical protein